MNPPDDINGLRANHDYCFLPPRRYRQPVGLTLCPPEGRRCALLRRVHLARVDMQAIHATLPPVNSPIHSLPAHLVTQRKLRVTCNNGSVTKMR